MKIPGLLIAVICCGLYASSIAVLAEENAPQKAVLVTGASTGIGLRIAELRRTVSCHATGAIGYYHPGPGLCPSQLVYGAQDFGGLSHHDEQGPGAYRGLLVI